MDTKEVRLVRVSFTLPVLHCVGVKVDSKMCNAIQVLLSLHEDQALALDDAQTAKALTQTRGRREALHNLQVNLRHPQHLTYKSCITAADGWPNMHALAVSLGESVIAHSQVQTQLDETDGAVSFETPSLCAVFHMLPPICCALKNSPAASKAECPPCHIPGCAALLLSGTFASARCGLSHG